MRDLLPMLMDHAVNRVSGIYSGFEPRRPRTLSIPRFIVIDDDIDPIPAILAEQFDVRRIRRPLVVCDRVTWGIAGEALFDQLRDRGMKPWRVEVAGNSYDEAARIVAEMSVRPRAWSAAEAPWERRLFGPKLTSMVFAVGGGSVLDVAKLAACQLHVPWVSVPTSLANDGVGSPFAVIDPGEHRAGSGNITVRAFTPLGIFIDLGRIQAGDTAFFERMMISGIGDAVSNLTAVADWRLAAQQGRDHLDYLALLHARSAGEVLLHRLGEGVELDDAELILTLASALVSSGEAMARVGSSRPASGFEHKLYHALHNVLRVQHRATHGILVAVGALISAQAHGCWLRPMGEAFGRLGLPVDVAGLRSFGLEPEAVEEGIRAARGVKPDRYTILEHLGEERMVEVFRELYRVG